ncbi:MAG: bifunctional UDP-N-acetylglucosamine diphosphorylase/glucosamine-1-phosphate N-acetyltransferase GlmU [Actinomycetota bacterium]|nr:bifunctional UDP-N-acetylglucosamine diphosphorylase/glucosamine-1-phosphate N-acetyltransferase GlmU [Actinomycetota bacterium]
MTDRKLATVVMAGGLGTRMRSELPKHLHPLLGRRVVDWVIEAALALRPDPLVVVTSPETADVFAGEGIAVAVQPEARGTGDAAAAARAVLAGFDGDLLVLSGDAPLLTLEVLEGLVAGHRESQAAATVLTFEPVRPLPYGHIVRGPEGKISAIVEDRDASDQERAIRELNSSTYVFDAKELWDALDELTPDNAQGELYLTDTVRALVNAGKPVATYKSDDPEAPIGINTRVELAAAAAVLRDRINERHMLAGATIVDPQATWIDPDVQLGPDAIVHPFTVLRGTTRVQRGAEVGPHVVAIDAEIGEHALVGPFCYLRPGTVLEAGAKAGTFVELKNSRIGEGTKVPHLSYIGDAEIGAETNIGAGAITANFPHEPDRPKGRTKIGRNVRTGVHNAFVAPLEIGDDAWIAVGSVVTDDVPPGSIAGFAPRQVTKEGYVYDKHGRPTDD